MIELGELLISEYERSREFSEISLRNVTELLDIVDQNTEIRKKISAEVKIITAIAALRVKIPAIKRRRVAEKWENIIFSDEVQRLLQVYAPLERPLKKKIEQTLSSFRWEVDFLEELSQSLAGFAANVSASEKWQDELQEVLELSVESMEPFV